MILASQSPRRIELMREAGYDIRVIPADIDETPFDVHRRDGPGAVGQSGHGLGAAGLENFGHAGGGRRGQDDGVQCGASGAYRRFALPS